MDARLAGSPGHGDDALLRPPADTAMPPKYTIPNPARAYAA